MLNTLRKNISNAIGWRTDRKIVVFESDDWGSVRTRDKEAYNRMCRLGLELERSNFTRYDSLETNADLERLFEVLQSVRDQHGNPAVFTPMCVVANPDFSLIKEKDFQEYAYETFDKTCNNYPYSENIPALWRQGVDLGLFVPQFHGREHLNVLRWMRALQAGDQALRIAFEHQSFGVAFFKGVPVKEHLAAFDPEFASDIEAYPTIIRSGGKHFEDLLGYQPAYFVASNSPEPKCLEKDLKDIGVRYLTRYKLQKYPLGEGKYRREFNWLGKKNSHGQLIITRNCGFEPSSNPDSDWVNQCLAEISNAFYWKKPAVISTHRVNYVSRLSQQNADAGLLALRQLLQQITAKYPDAEFMTSVQLGDMIKQ